MARQFDVDVDQVRNVARRFVWKMKDGLARRQPCQIPTYVRSVATGSERGRFLAVDLGGSNCRICLVDLRGDATFAVVQAKHAVPPRLMVNPSHRPLFAFIAAKLADFLQTHVAIAPAAAAATSDAPADGRYRLGFTFSFTCDQTSLARGTLIHWDKGWDIPDAVGRDPCAMLQEAIDERALPVLVSVLANDSVGTLLTRSYTSGAKQHGSTTTTTLAAVIFGTGTNAAYVEKLSNIRWLGSHARPDDDDNDDGDDDIMVVNTEWGCFDDEMTVLPRTPFDDELDARSTAPGSQMLEKRVSGLYLGELLRLTTLRLLRRGALHMQVDGRSPLFRQGGLDSAFLSQLARQSDAAAAGRESDEKAVQLVSEALLATNVTSTDVQCIRLVSAAIARRAARLAGASLAAVVIHSGRLDRQRRRRQQHHAAAAAAAPPSPKPISTKLGKDADAGSRPSLFSQFRIRLGLLIHRILSLVRGGSVAAATSPSPQPLPPAPQPKGVESLDASTDEAESLDEEDVIDIGADGSLIEFYPSFEADMRAAMREVPEIGAEGERRIRIGLAKDGSGVGAALMAQAAMASEE
ncbi:hypothetical protein VTK73DRAFT_4190 [Phialemonium thermophilum]|uniref:Phosphotransferase n=1 Tax=Phialemonium thermophilum TaxID=223376 RepID=A0ABR3VAY5_9PEZI